ncbi:DUF4139 domain-containing protein, partial [Mycobacterium tuberculosis]|nr:DUF4139 domain-containing protein [Mycobacterium tuberculosis]
ANVEQETGEDWRDVALTLSTTQPSRGTDAGTLPVIVGRFAPPSPPPPRPLAGAGADGAARMKTAPMMAEAPAPIAAREREATLEANG